MSTKNCFSILLKTNELVEPEDKQHFETKNQI